MAPQSFPQAAHLQRQEYLQSLLAEIGQLRQQLMAAAGRDDSAPISSVADDSPPQTAASLNQLCHLFGLAPFERQILLLCAGLELDLQFGALCAQLQGHSSRTYPTLGLAIALFPNADPRVFSNQQPLQRWRLVEITPGYAMAQAPLRLSPRILCYLTGDYALTTELASFWRSADLPDPNQNVDKGMMAASHRAIATQLTRLWSQAKADQSAPVIQLHGPDASIQRQITAHTCQQENSPLAVISWSALLRADPPRHELQQLCWREVLLTNSRVLIECHGVPSHQLDWAQDLQTFVEGLNTPLIISTPERLSFPQRPLMTIEIEPLTYAEQRQLWQTHLGAAAAQFNGHIDRLASQFNLNPGAIAAACLAFQEDAAQNADFNPKNETAPTIEPLTQLWGFCRVQARYGLDALAQRIDTKPAWEDLVLPEDHKATLKTLAVHLRQRSQVYQHWGFAAKGSRGLGTTALFSGESGTGKTMAAEVVAQELQLDLYRIDLSAVVSKYIGETEKNLQRIFDAAETGGAILLFDEADALFGKRTEVKDSHDRHANVEVSYLLQRMEAYRGLAILTTNLKSSMDKAFLRRLQFMLTFPFPDAKAREEIWRRIFPPETPTEGLKYSKLANLNVTGGNIRSIALNAAFLAAEAGSTVTMEHLLTATHREYAKLETRPSKTETNGWLTPNKPKASPYPEE
ncbi:MAG: AAA family ATPase [Leptolyngbyaceae cyanobacterium MO_188.B28]|nr:AAA family ATPase [Leptolyngbyaceae cyanobacterium MO_188.B28]